MTNPSPLTYWDKPAVFAYHVLGVTPHESQVEWLHCRAKIKIACCGRRWGKSFAEAVDLIWFALRHRKTTQFLIAPTHDQSTIIFAYVCQMLAETETRFPGIVKKIVQSPFPEIRFANGSVIKARSAGDDAKNLRGHEADRIVLDEAAFIPDEVYTTIAPLLATSPFGELVLISTPFGRNTFFDYWQRGQGDDPAVRSFRFRSSDNPHVSRAYLEQQKRDMTRMAYAVEYDAEFSEDQANVFKWSLIQSCIDADPPVAPLSDHRYVIGYDPAKWVDRSGVVVLDVTQRPWRAVDVRDIAGRDYLAQAPVIRELSTSLHHARVLLDATSHDQLLEHLRRDAVPAEGYQFTNASKQELINGLVIAMEQGDVTFPNHPDLVKELTYYRFELTAAGNVKLGAPDKAGHHDDLVTALALAVHHARVSPGGALLAGSTTEADMPPQQTAFSQRLKAARQRRF